MRGIGGRLTRAALRNALRVPRRLGLTVGLLAVGGGLFVTATSVATAWTAMTARVLVDRRYDVEVRLEEPVSRRALTALDPDWEVETWGTVPVTLADPGGLPLSRTYPDGGHGSFELFGAPTDLPLTSFRLREGRWLGNGPEEVVLNQLAASRVGADPVGRRIDLVVEGKPATWTVVGVVEEVAAPAAAYVPATAFTARTGQPLQTMRIGTGAAGLGAARSDIARLQDRLAAAGVPLERVAPRELLFNAMGEHVEVLVQSLSGLAILMAVVGVLALASTMSTSVVERTRELGVLRAIGARPAQLRRMVLVEGWFVTALSLPGALLVAVLLTAVVGRVVGQLAFELPLPLVLSVPALLGWTVAVMVVASLASLVPARSAIRLAVREALSRV